MLSVASPSLQLQVSAITAVMLSVACILHPLLPTLAEVYRREDSDCELCVLCYLMFSAASGMTQEEMKSCRVFFNNFDRSVFGARGVERGQCSQQRAVLLGAGCRKHLNEALRLLICVCPLSFPILQS